MRLASAVLLLTACSSHAHYTVAPSTPVSQSSAEQRAAGREARTELSCADAVAVFTAGTTTETVCPKDALARGLTVLDLRDAWTPSLFGEQPDGSAPAFRDTYLDLAREQDPTALSELYGVVPSLAVARTRLADTERHACRAKAGGSLKETLACEHFTTTEQFQRRNFLLPTDHLDADTKAALAVDSREQDFRLALRILRERVADASGLIEDGTAGDGPAKILDRALDPVPMRGAKGHEDPLPDAAPDLISPATEAAATALGWTSPDALAAYFTAHPDGLRVALPLPTPPAYHTTTMTLSAVIDRGDVWYDAKPRARHITHRPTLVIYADDAGTKRALVRWPTTIGGWSSVTTPSGKTVTAWKESDVGPRVWRNLYAAPTWMPPETTPDSELYETAADGTPQLKKNLFGPSPFAAYGLVLFQHEKPLPQPDGTMKWWTNWIGTHGSANVPSIVDGNSHGCHRLYNQLSVRLADFVLRHHDHLARGIIKSDYQRTVTAKSGETFDVKVDTRGFLYELTPPIPVDVTAGTIRTKRKTPPTSSAPASE